MDQVSLVDSRIDDGQKVLLQLVRDGFDVAAAFWLKAPEETRWHLVIASKVTDQVGPGDAYRALQASLQRLPGICVSLDDIRLIGVANPTVGAVRKLLQQAGGTHAVGVRDGQFGHLLVEEAYVYPAPSRQLKRGPLPLGKLKLTRPVQQTPRGDEVAAPLSPLEFRAREQILASGISPAQADYWVRKKREEERTRPPIPAGTVVDAQVVAWWGEKPEDDPNPLLLVKAADGAQGLTFKNHTEPI
jgi:hypothetical protein